MTSTYLSLFDQIWNDPDRLEDVTSNLCDSLRRFSGDGNRVVTNAAGLFVTQATAGAWRNATMVEECSTSAAAWGVPK